MLTPLPVSPHPRSGWLRVFTYWVDDVLGHPINLSPWT